MEHEVCWSPKGAPERTITPTIPIQARLATPLENKAKPA